MIGGGTGLDRGGRSRAVSDTVGYVLVFALITGTVAIVFTVGIAGLSSSQQSEQVNNVERAFDVLADNLRDIQRYDDPSRATEVRLADGTLRFDDATVITVEVYNGSSGNVTDSVTLSSQPIVYADDSDTTIAYDAGMVVRSDHGNSVMLNSPRFVVRDGEAVLPFVETYPRGDRVSIGGDGTVLVIGHRQSQRTDALVADGSTERVNVTVASERIDAWNRTFARADDFTFLSEEGESATYRMEGVESITVTRTIVEIELSN